MTQRHVRQGRRHLRRQREIVQRLREIGADVITATALLAEFETTLAEHQAHRESLSAGLRSP